MEAALRPLSELRNRDIIFGGNEPFYDLEPAYGCNQS
jgi:hypothetical protein